jgi:hypothetical protein
VTTSVSLGHGNLKSRVAESSMSNVVGALAELSVLPEGHPAAFTAFDLLGRCYQTPALESFLLDCHGGAPAGDGVKLRLWAVRE